MGAGHAHALYLHGHSPLHRITPAPKVAAVLVYVVAVAITPREALWAFAVHGLIAVGVVAIASIPIRFLLARLLATLPFVLFAVLIPFIASGERVDVLGISLSLDGLWSAWNILAKALLGATASIVLVATTEIPDILRGMTRLRIPTTLMSIAGFMVRYLELIVEEMARTRVAMISRGHEPRWLWQAVPASNAAGAMLVRSYERGERVHGAMLARGFNGVMPALDEHDASAGSWMLTMTVPFISLMTAITALFVT